MTKPQTKSGAQKNKVSNLVGFKSNNLKSIGVLSKSRSFNSFLNKELSTKSAAKVATKPQDENKPSMIQVKQIEELKEKIQLKEKRKSLIQKCIAEFDQLESSHQASDKEIEAALSDLVKVVSNKFDEYIIDEDEIFGILTAVDMILKQPKLHLDDKIDI